MGKNAPEPMRPIQEPTGPGNNTLRFTESERDQRAGITGPGVSISRAHTAPTLNVPVAAARSPSISQMTPIELQRTSRANSATAGSNGLERASDGSSASNGTGLQRGSFPRAEDEISRASFTSGGEDLDDETPHSGPWLRRVQARSQDLRLLFGLPDDELLLDDFHCALRKRVLLQGRMYVFQHNVCFISRVFGYTKKKVMPLKFVTSVRKKKNYGFPNSIEIIWQHGKKEFFTSMLSREAAYSLIVAAWHQCSGYAKLFAETEERPAPMRPVHRRSLSSEAGKRGQTDDSEADAALAGNGSGGIMSAAASLVRPPKFIRRLSARGEKADPNRAASQDMEGMSPLSPLPPPMEDLEGESAEDEAGPEERTTGPGGGQSRRDSDDNSDADETDTASTNSWTIEEGPLPERMEGMRPALEATFDTTPRQFFESFFSDEAAPFTIKMHETRGDTKIQVSEWHRHYAEGRVREVNFVSVIRAPVKIGPPTTHANQTQRYRVYPGDHLVLETSQVMNDIPYGDHFTVETRWDVTPVPPTPDGIARCHLHVMVAIPFSRHTFLRKAIESTTTSSIKEMLTHWVAMASAAIKPAPPPAPSPPPAAPVDGLPPPPPRVNIGPRAPHAEDDQVNVEDLISRLSAVPPKHRSDIARMLNMDSADLRSPKGNPPPSGGYDAESALLQHGATAPGGSEEQPLRWWAGGPMAPLGWASGRFSSLKTTALSRQVLFALVAGTLFLLQVFILLRRSSFVAVPELPSEPHGASGLVDPLAPDTAPIQALQEQLAAMQGQLAALQASSERLSQDLAAAIVKLAALTSADASCSADVALQALP